MIIGLRCVFCRKIRRKREYCWSKGIICLCTECADKLPPQKLKKIICEDPTLAFVIPCVYYTGALKDSFKDYKFNGYIAYAEFYRHIMRRQLQGRDELRRFDFVATVPISKQRLMKRGYNQSDFVGETVAEVSGLPLLNDCLIKVKDTATQSALSPYERINNIKGAYAVSGSVSGKNILLADDIYTSGATMGEAARTLKAAGANTVAGVVFAAASLRSKEQR